MRYFCHHCNANVNADELLPDFTCPVCNSGFVEEISTPARRNSNVDDSHGSNQDDDPPRYDEYSDDNSDVEFFEATGPLANIFDLFQATANAPATNSTVYARSAAAAAIAAAAAAAAADQSSGQQPTDRQQSSDSTSGTTGTSNPQEFRMVTRPLSRSSARNAPQQGQTPYSLETTPANQTLADVLHDFISGVSFGTHYPDGSSSSQSGASGSGHVPARTFITNIDFPLPLHLHSNPGDYAWGNAGFDAVITQLLNNLDGSNSGPPPMPKDQVESLKSVKISEEQVKSNLQCTVCMEDFQVGHIARQLPCEHLFHQDCIIPWLDIHASCPICRKTFVSSSNPTQNTSSDNNTTSETTNANSATANSASATVSNHNVTPNYDYTEDDCD